MSPPELGKMFYYSPRRFIFILGEKRCSFRFSPWEMCLCLQEVGSLARSVISTSTSQAPIRVIATPRVPRRRQDD